MDIRYPSKKVCEEFHLTYELKGAQKAIDLLSNYYEIRRMRIVLNGRKVGNHCDASYDKNVAYFTKEGLNRFSVLHEFYHHLVFAYEVELSVSKEENEANRFSREVLRN